MDLLLRIIPTEYGVGDMWIAFHTGSVVHAKI